MITLRFHRISLIINRWRTIFQCHTQDLDTLRHAADAFKETITLDEQKYENENEEREIKMSEVCTLDVATVLEVISGVFSMLRLVSLCLYL